MPENAVLLKVGGVSQKCMRLSFVVSTVKTYHRFNETKLVTFKCMYHVAPPLKIQGGVVYFNVKPQPKLKLNQVIFGAVTSPNSQ